VATIDVIEHMCMAKFARQMSTLEAVVEHTCELYPEPFGMVAHTRSLLSSVPLNPKHDETLRHFRSVISQDDLAHKTARSIVNTPHCMLPAARC
jgi:hypothetical protein